MVQLFYSQLKEIIKTNTTKQKNDFFKSLDHSQNNCEGITQCKFVPLGPTLTYKTSNFKNLSKWYEANQCIDGDMWTSKNQHPHHNLPQTFSWRKSICLVWIRPADNFLTHLRRSFRINELWSNRVDTHKPKINIRRLEQRTWRINYIR